MIDSEDEDLNDLLEYNFQLKFNKLIKVIHKKSDSIKTVFKELESIKTMIQGLDAGGEEIRNFITETRQRNSEIEVYIFRYL